MERLNFSWLIDKVIAGHSAPISDDDFDYLKSKGITALVRMAESDNAQVTPTQIEKAGFTDCHEPVSDFTAPKQGQVDRMIAFITESVSAGKAVGVSCGAGIGRTGTVLACYLVRKCYTAEEAMEEVKHKRGAGVETEDQREAVQTYAKRLGKE